MEFVQSERGKRKLIYDGYIYVKQKELANSVISYECEKRRHSNCKAKVKVFGNEVIDHVNEHTHAADICRPEVLFVREKIKSKAINTQETAQQIITQTVQSISEGASTQLPPVRHVRRAIRRYKQAASVPHPIPSNLTGMVIPSEYKMTADGEDFLLYDSGLSDQRMLVFSTAKNIRLLENSTDWFGDGTFKVVPELFYQLYTIHCLTSKRIIPCVYALLPNKQRATYQDLLQQLLTINPMLNPQSFLIDYEQAARSAIEEVFPNVTVKGCFFHLSQNIYRKVQSEGLQGKYQTDVNFALKIRMLPALAFIPSDEVVDAFETLQNTMPPEADPITDYFEDTYIGRTRRRNRRAPRFPVSMWNMYDRVVEDLPRTNNSLEGWHNHMQANITSFHPNIWKFLEVLKREQALTSVTINQVLAGHPAPPTRKRYQDLTGRIANIVQDYENRHVLDFLRGIAHNLQF